MEYRIQLRGEATADAAFSLDSCFPASVVSGTFRLFGDLIKKQLSPNAKVGTESLGRGPFIEASPGLRE